MNISVGAKTDVGLVRDHNEDSFCVNTKNRIFVAADGMGGHAAGEVASNQLKDYIEEFLVKDQGQENIAECLQQAVQKANRRIYDMGLSDPSKRGMGTTATILVLVDDEYFIAQVGDSRAYLYRKGELTQITRDHSKVFQLYEQGIIEKDDIEKHPFSNIITRSIGNHFTVEADIYRGQVLAGDRFLLCSDGLTGELRDAEIAVLLERHPIAQECCEQLVRKAIACGGKDNVTCLIVNLVGDDDVERKTTPLIREELESRMRALEAEEAVTKVLPPPSPEEPAIEPTPIRHEPRRPPVRESRGESEKEPGSITIVRARRQIEADMAERVESPRAVDEEPSSMAAPSARSSRGWLGMALLVLLLVGAAWFLSRPTTGRLEISSTPAAAEVYLDGRFAGKTPLSLDSVTSGRHELSIALDQHQTEETVVVIRSDRLNKKEFRLRPRR